MNSILMIFLDGVGIGEKDPEKNPFFKFGFKTFSEIFGQIPHLENQKLVKDNYFLFPTDARLGIEGLPQSGTGQTSIFCGINAAEYVGKHFGPYPYSTLIPVIEEKNIFKHYLQNNQKANFVNAYPQVFFDYINSGKKSRLSVTSLSAKLSGLKLNEEKEVREGKALTAEITNERWNKKLGYDLPIIEAETAAERLIKIAEENKFTLYEYFLTDHLGHGRYDWDFENTFKTLDRFLLKVIQEIKGNLTLLICSDHGNIEDISIKTHTLNPSVTITAGKFGKELSETIKDITQIKSSLINICK